jgi:hypothetical protein
MVPHRTTPDQPTTAGRSGPQELAALTRALLKLVPDSDPPPGFAERTVSNIRAAFNRGIRTQQRGEDSTPAGHHTPVGAVGRTAKAQAVRAAKSPGGR